MEDMLPQDGSTFDPEIMDADQEKEVKAYVAKAETYYPVIDEFIADFEKDIAEADSLTKLKIDASMPAIQVQIINEGNIRYINKLREKVETLRQMKEAVKG